MKSFIQIAHFAKSLVRTLNGEKIKHRSCHQYRSRIHEEQQSGMVHTVRNHAKQILFGIAVRIAEDAVENAHWQCGDIAGRHRHLYSFVECRDMSGLKTAPAGANDADPLGVNFRAGKQVIYGAYSIPDFPPGKVRSRQIRQVAHHRMFGADQIVAALRRLGLPELAALSLPDPVPRQHDVSPFREPLTQLLIIDFPVGCVPSRQQYGPASPCTIVWDIDDRGNIHTEKTLKDQFFDEKPSIWILPVMRGCKS